MGPGWVVKVGPGWLVKVSQGDDIRCVSAESIGGCVNIDTLVTTLESNSGSTSNKECVVHATEKSKTIEWKSTAFFRLKLGKLSS